MIVLLLLRSIAFAALFSAPWDWKTKVFLGSALLLIEFSITLLDFQADENHHTHHLLLVTAFTALDRRLGDTEAPSVESSLEEVFRHEAMKEGIFPLWKSNFIVFFGSVVTSLVIGWLLSLFAFSAAP